VQNVQTYHLKCRWGLSVGSRVKGQASIALFTHIGNLIICDQLGECSTFVYIIRDRKLRRPYIHLAKNFCSLLALTRSNIESSEVWSISRIKPDYYWGKLVSSACRKCLKPVTIQLLLTGAAIKPPSSIILYSCLCTLQHNSIHSTGSSATLLSLQTDQETGQS